MNGSDKDESSSIESKLSQWLNKQGYPLEMRVASTIRNQTNLDLRHSWHYKDPETGRSREIDIVCTATDQLGMAEINFVIECKGTKKPWILFTSEEATSSYSILHSFGLFSELAFSEIATKLFGKYGEKETRDIPWLLKDGQVGYSITQGFDGNQDIAYSGTLSAIKAAVWLKENSFWSNPDNIKFSVSFPIVVTSSPLFQCYLDKKAELVLKPIKHGFLFFNQHIEGLSPTCVTIVHESYLETFIKECQEVSNYLLSALEPALEKERQDIKSGKF